MLPTTVRLVAEAAVEHVYSYPFASAASPVPRGVRLAVATSGGDAEREPIFYNGALVNPLHVARLLIAVSGIAAARFYVPPRMLQRILLAADPVVLSDGERLRFEALSSCCGVYARADFLPDALAEAPVARGTTNVDFNPPMRAALASLRARTRRCSWSSATTASGSSGRTRSSRSVA